MTTTNKFTLILIVIETISVVKIADNKLLSRDIDIKPPSSKNNTAVLPALVWKNPTKPSINSPVIFYSPHQDDETLAMGASIAECIRIGKPVYVVLFTNGASSAALLSLNGITPCRYHHTT